MYSMIYDIKENVFGFLCSFSVLFYESCLIYTAGIIENGKLLCKDSEIPILKFVDFRHS